MWSKNKEQLHPATVVVRAIYASDGMVLQMWGSLEHSGQFCSAARATTLEEGHTAEYCLQSSQNHGHGQGVDRDFSTLPTGACVPLAQDFTIPLSARAASPTPLPKGYSLLCDDFTSNNNFQSPMDSRGK